MTFRSRVGGVLLGVTMVALVGVVPSSAQDPEKDKASDGVVKTVGAVKAYRRVPPYFAKVGLTPEQRERIYAVRGKHQQEIDALKARIDELEATELSECESILLEPQKKMLMDLRASAKPTRKAR
jgi:hypothetical protein